VVGFLQIVIAILIFLVVARVGLWLLRTIGNPPPPPPPPGKLRRVDLRYRCGLCGTEVRATRAPEEQPDPPRHCGEEMELLEEAG